MLDNNFAMAYKNYFKKFKWLSTRPIDSTDE